MKSIEIYTKTTCPFCHRAKHLLEQKGVPFMEYDITHDETKALEMRTRSARTTVPEIFVDDRLVGGWDDLHALEQGGRLDELLRT